MPASAVNWDGEKVIVIDEFARNSVSGSGGFSQKSPPLLTVIQTVTTPAPLAGDGDGKVDIKDATLSLQIAVGNINPTDQQKVAGDVNHDGKLDLKDTTLILKKAVGL